MNLAVHSMQLMKVSLLQSARLCRNYTKTGSPVKVDFIVVCKAGFFIHDLAEKQQCSTLENPES